MFCFCVVSPLAGARYRQLMNFSVLEDPVVEAADGEAHHAEDPVDHHRIEGATAVVDAAIEDREEEAATRTNRPEEKWS